MKDQIVLRAIRLFFRLIPFPVIWWVGDGVGFLLYRLLKKRSAIGLANLSRAFPDMPERERIEILKAFWRNLCKDMLELIRYYAYPAAVKGKLVTLVGREHLDALMAQKTGIILLSAHLGNFPLLCMKLGMEGYPISVVYGEVHNRFFNPVLPHIMRSMGIEPIFDMPRHACIGKSISWLKNKGMLFIQVDQNPLVEAGVPVDFFGFKVPIARGPISLAMRTAAKIVPVFIVRDKNNHHRVIVEEPLTLRLEGNGNHHMRENLEALSKVTEDHIKKYPTLWWWVHQRFKMAVKE
jgi:KDO2-lipid IV(A) lauroyltransferase